MKKKGKKYQAVIAKVDTTKLYTVEEACALVKETSTVKFDATVDVSFRFNVDPKYADQQLRGTLVLPHGNGKTKKILAITHKEEEAKQAGADFVGGKELLQKIQTENWFDFDIIVATPDMMGELGKMGRILGPKGLMPNPKTGTVTMNIGQAITEIKKGKIEYRVDKEGNIGLSFGNDTSCVKMAWYCNGNYICSTYPVSSSEPADKMQEVKPEDEKKSFSIADDKKE